MSVLSRYARPTTTSKESEKRSLSVRIPADLYERWQEECERNGLTMSEGTRLVLELALKNELEPPRTMESAPRSPRNRAYSSPNRFTMGAYTIDGLAPCPVCGNWQSATNYSRHAGTAHGKSSEELITENMETVKVMLEEKRGF